ncbi:PucR family transcriptional regulator [Pseudonocardia xinjiangensis]|uniref:PucR family transcriptional regulator n=1 Tax=Pseudonocardia xinjiangensis TaxID=75289 RepID=UPI003D8C7A98
MPRPDHEEMVREHFRGLLAGLAARRLPARADAEHARAMGRRRAQQGVAVEEVLSAYHLGYRDVWNTLLSRAHTEDPGQAARLLGLVNLVWAWLRVITIAVADGHAETTRAREENRIGLGHELLDALYAGRVTAESTELLAHALAFDPHAEFQAICCPAGPWPPADLDVLRRRLRAEPGTSSAITRGPVLVIVFQRTSAERILDLLGRDTSPMAGVGLVRPGLAGAAAAVVDAERSLAVAQRNGGGVVRFGSEWLAATLLPHMDRLRQLTDTTAAVEQPHLCDAVRAFADNGFSVTASARALHVHPNTVKYRLDRWKQHTGWDPRTLDGLQRSLLGIAFSSSASVPEAGSQ